MDADDLAFAGAARQAELVRRRDVSAAEVVRATLDRIERFDPRLNAFRVVFAERAREEAEVADRRPAAAGQGGLLSGVTVAIKDDVDVAGEVTARGASAAGTAAPRDAEVVRRLRAAGAIVVGKTHVSELTAWPFTESRTWGATRNPWDLSRTPGGSSGGTAAAVAAGLCGLGSGGDGGGSIRIPAAWCGVFGCKPDRGRVPGAPDAWHGLGVNGPLARHVADAALYLDATSQLPAPAGGFRAAVAEESPPVRVALVRAPPPGAPDDLQPSQAGALTFASELLTDLGHAVVERRLRYPRDAVVQVGVRYFASVADDLASVPVPQSLEDRTRDVGRWGARIPASLLRAVRRREVALAEAVDALLTDHDALLMPGPTAGPWRIGELAGGSMLETLRASAARAPHHGVFNVTGHPACSVPAGYDTDGLPVGVQLVGRRRDEATLLRLASQLEAVTRSPRQRPLGLRATVAEGGPAPPGHS